MLSQEHVLLGKITVPNIEHLYVLLTSLNYVLYFEILLVSHFLFINLFFTDFPTVSLSRPLSPSACAFRICRNKKSQNSHPSSWDLSPRLPSFHHSALVHYLRPWQNEPIVDYYTCHSAPYKTECILDSFISEASNNSNAALYSKWMKTKTQ